jgi:large subunit ribosomal protein L1
MAFATGNNNIPATIATIAATTATTASIARCTHRSVTTITHPHRHIWWHSHHYRSVVTTTTLLLRRPIVLLSQQQQQQQQCRSYISRAHPRSIPEYALPDVIQMILQDIERRKQHQIHRESLRSRRSQQSQPQPVSSSSNKNSSSSSSSSPPVTTTKSTTTTTTTTTHKNHPNETLELAVMLNLDPRKPGQSLRGSVTLPHGTGIQKKGQNCIVVLTTDETMIEQVQLLAAGSSTAAGGGARVVAGGEALVDQIVSGTMAVDTIASVFAMSDMVPVVTRKAARILGPRGLMPNHKVGTIHTNAETLLAALESAVAGKEITYRTEKEGIVHVPVGKATFPLHKILDNIGTVMKTIMDVKPDSYGKGKKKASGKKGQAVSAKNQPKYLLRVVMSSTQSPGYRVDLRTIDPGSAFFLSTLDPIQASQKDDTTKTPHEEGATSVVGGGDASSDESGHPNTISVQQ